MFTKLSVLTKGEGLHIVQSIANKDSLYEKNHVYFCRALLEDPAKLVQQEPRETEYVITSLYRIEKSSA